MKKQQHLRYSLTTCVVASILCFGPLLSFSQTGHRIKNIVIVHGAFADASGWEAVYNILKKDGYNVCLVQNPLTSLKADVAATNVVLDKVDGPLVLVGHSWAGSVITQAGVSPKVVSLVYVAAYMPDAGETSLGVTQSAPALPLNGILPPDKNGLLWFDKKLFHECFCAELSDEKARFMFDSQQPYGAACLTDVITQVAWKTKPSYAIVATQDKCINPVLERSMYKRAGAKVTEIKGNHVLFMSHPEEVARVIETAAKAGSVKN